MVQIKAQKIIKKNDFVGEPKLSNFEIIDEELPALQNGEVMAEAEYLSVDPYMRAYQVDVGNVMIGGQVAKVLDSKNPKFPVGAYIFGYMGWRTCTVFNPDKLMSKPYVLPNFGSHPRSLAIGAVGMPGNTAYFGFLELCKPKAGETLVVSGAAGGVGSLVGQIGKIKGLKVIGIAGSDDKCDWLKNELGFDYVINYKTADLATELAKAAPEGVDCYFDNVGGEISSIVIKHMNLFGRISVCGSISAYNNVETAPKVDALQKIFLFKQLRMEGFKVYRWADRWLEGLTQMLKWIHEGKIKYQETVTTGFQNMPQAFIDMLNGKNVGKAIIKV